MRADIGIDGCNIQDYPIALTPELIRFVNVLKDDGDHNATWENLPKLEFLETAARCNFDKLCYGEDWHMTIARRSLDFLSHAVLEKVHLVLPPETSFSYQGVIGGIKHFNGSFSVIMKEDCR